MELDVVGYSPKIAHLVHYETSVDGDSWEKREVRFRNKFNNGRRFILTEVFDWLPQTTPIEQFAVCVTHKRNTATIGGGKLLSIDEFVAEIRAKVIAEGVANSNAISESFPLLRTMQLSHSGYNRIVNVK